MTMGPLSAAVVLADRALREQAFDCINNLPVRVVSDQRVEDSDELLDRIERFRVDVLLLEGGLLKIPLDDFVRRLKMTASEPAIFILHTEAIPDNILEAMRSGASEYICPPVSVPLKEAFERLSGMRTSQISSQQKKLGRIYGLLSAKGGCGATTFASHLGPMAARQAEKPLLLADLDFEAGLLRFILKAKPRYSLRDALDNMHRMDSSYWNALITRQDTQLEFIAAPEKLSERTTPDPRQLGKLLRFIRSIYPVAILDFGRCYSAGALEALPEMEALYLLTTHDIHAIENAKDFITMAESRGRGADRIQVLLNKVPPRQKPDIDGLETYLGLRPSGVFSDDTEALYEAWSEGQLLNGGSVLGRQLMALAKTIMTPEAATGPGESASKGSGQKLTSPAAMGLGRLFFFMRSGRD